MSAAATQRPAVGVGKPIGVTAGKRQVDGGLAGRPTGYYGMLSLLSKGTAHKADKLAALEVASLAGEKTAVTGKKHTLEGSGAAANKVDHLASGDNNAGGGGIAGKMSVAGRFHAQVTRPLHQQHKNEEKGHTAKRTYSATTAASKERPHIVTAASRPPSPHFGRRPPPPELAAVPSVFEAGRVARESVERVGRRKEPLQASVGPTPGGGHEEISRFNQQQQLAQGKQRQPAQSGLSTPRATTISGAKLRPPSPYRKPDMLTGNFTWVEGATPRGSSTNEGHHPSKGRRSSTPTFKSTVGGCLGGNQNNTEATPPPRSSTPRGRRTGAVDYTKYVPVLTLTKVEPTLRHSVPMPRPSQIFTKQPAVYGSDAWDYKCISAMSTHPEYFSRPPVLSRRRNSDAPAASGGVSGSVSLVGGATPEVKISSASSCGGDSIAASSIGRAGVTRTPDPSSRFGRRQNVQPGASPKTGVETPRAASAGRRQFGRTSSDLGMLQWGS